MNRGLVIARNTIFLIISRVVMAISSLILFAQAGRSLGVDGFGIFTLALTYSRFVYVISDFGAGYLTVREVSRNKAIGGKVLLSGITIKIVPIVTVILTLIIVVNQLYENYAIIQAILIAGVASIIEALGNFIRAFFNAHEKMQFTSLLLVGESLTILGVGSLLLHLGYSATIILAGYCFVYLISAITAFGLLFNQLHLVPEWDIKFTKFFLRESIPFITFTAFGVLYSRIDTILLSILAPSREIAVGIYQASFKLISSLDYLPDMITKSAFPSISSAYKNEQSYAIKLSNRILKYLILISIPIAIGIFLLAKDIITLVYDVEFTTSALVMQILAWVVPLRYANFLFGTVLSATDNQWYRALTTGVVFLMNIILNLIFIPRYGYLGSAAINFVSMLIVFSMYYIISTKNFAPLKIWSHIRPSMISSLIMAVSILILKEIGFHALILIPLGILIYFFCLHITQAVGEEDYHMFRRIFQSILTSK